MADIRNPVGAPALVPQGRPTVRSEAVRAAQKAFFEAALSGAPTSPAPSATPVTAAAQTAKLDLQSPPARTLRPGSLIDIKV